MIPGKLLWKHYWKKLKYFEIDVDIMKKFQEVFPK